MQWLDMSVFELLHSGRVMRDYRALPIQLRTSKAWVSEGAGKVGSNYSQIPRSVCSGLFSVRVWHFQQPTQPSCSRKFLGIPDTVSPGRRCACRVPYVNQHPFITGTTTTSRMERTARTHIPNLRHQVFFCFEKTAH